MTSREIADLTGKNHFDVLRDIRTMLEQLEITDSSFAVSYKDSTGRALAAFKLPKDLIITLVSGYSVVMRHRKPACPRQDPRGGLLLTLVADAHEAHLRGLGPVREPQPPAAARTTSAVDPRNTWPQRMRMGQ